MKYAIRWSQLQPPTGHEPYPWAFILAESAKLALIWALAWWVMALLFPAA